MAAVCDGARCGGRPHARRRNERGSAVCVGDAVLKTGRRI